MWYAVDWSWFKMQKIFHICVVPCSVKFFFLTAPPPLMQAVMPMPPHVSHLYSHKKLNEFLLTFCFSVLPLHTYPSYLLLNLHWFTAVLFLGFLRSEKWFKPRIYEHENLIAGSLVWKEVVSYLDGEQWRVFYVLETIFPEVLCLRTVKYFTDDSERKLYWSTYEISQQLYTEPR
jgi:hypothetical protein